MNPVRIAIIGAGNIAGVHAAAIQHVEGAVLTVVCNRTQASGEALAAKHGARWVGDAAEAVSAADVDAVIVTTPSGSHAEPAIGAARNGKHVLVEKPLDITLERVDAMLAAARESGVVFAGVFQSRFGAGVRAAKAAVEAGRLGRLVLANASVPWHRDAAYYRSGGGWRGTRAVDGGGALMNQAIHALDLLQHLAGPVARVTAQTRTLVHAIETEDTASAVIELASGGLGSVQGTTALWPGSDARVELYGSDGCIVLTDGRVSSWRLRDAEEGEEAAMLALETATGSGSADPMGIGIEKHVWQVRDFVEAVRGEHPPAVDGEEGRRAVELVLAIYDSAARGEPVRLTGTA